MEKGTSIKIALTEDNLINRNTFLQKINHLDGYELVFVARNGHECLEQLKSLTDPQRPAVIFMDLEMPQMDGSETIAIARTLYPNIHFLVLTIFDDDEKIFEAIKAGAAGYLLKHEPAQVLSDAVSSVLEYGGAPMSPAIARKALQMLSKSPHHVESQNSAFPYGITEREKSILQHMVSGWDAKRIASALDLSVLTVRKHIANIYEKLHIHSKAEAISLAYREGWFS
jgi:DNA-binding NarL/FixJ family response regulator